MNDANLEALKHARRAKQFALASALRAVQLAASQVTDESARVADCERVLDAARTRPVYDAAAIALESARKDHALASKRLSDRQGEYDRATFEARAAEMAVVKVVDTILGNEIVERARQVTHHLDEAQRLGTTLKYFAAAAGIHATTIAPAGTLAILDRLDAPVLDLWKISPNLRKLGDIPAFREWVARRAAMIDDETTAQAA